jgi:CheY-like chemotaxis protein
MNNQKILVIENESHARDRIVEILKNDYLHIEVDKAFADIVSKGDTEELHEHLQELIKNNCKELRAIICDLNLTESHNQFESGVDLIKWIRTECRILPHEANDIYFKAIPIIVCTKKDFTNCSPNEYYNVIKAGADDIITKSEGDGSSFDDDLKNSLKPRLKRFGEICENLSFYEYKIGISYTWASKEEKHHEFVDEIARLLSIQFAGGRVLYDEMKQEAGETIGLTPEKFSLKYKNDCEYILVCLSKDYNKRKNSWTKDEWTKIKEVFEKDFERVFFLPIEELDLKEVYEHLGITDKKKQTIAIKNAFKIRNNYYNVLNGKGDKQKSSWSAILEGSKHLQEFVNESFDERNKIIKESITASITNVILGKIKDRQRSQDLLR